MKFLHKTQPFFCLFSKQQNSAIKVVTYRKMSQKCYETRICYKGEIKTIIIIIPIFSVPKSQNSNEEENNFG